MHEQTFYGCARSGNRRFKLCEHHLEITTVLERKNVNYSDIDINYERGEKKLRQGYIVPILCALLGCLLAWWVDTAILTPIIAFTALCFLALIDNTPVEFVRFKNARGKTLFEVFRPARNGHRYDEFIKALVARLSVEGQGPSQ